MLNARKKIATLAVASAIGAGGMMMSVPAQALNVSQNNMGEVLFFPYYTVKNGTDTVFSVVNTTNKTAVFKIRFREALNSREVRDFNVVMSPYDHWAAAVTSDGAGGAVVRTFDKTCTSPILPASSVAGATEIGLTNYLYTSASASLTPGGTDNGGVGIDRTQEGYFEVFLMGVSTASTSTSTNVVEYNAKHVSGVPRSCTTVDNAFLSAAGAVAGTPFSTFSAPQDILKGHVSYINVANGQSFDAEPTAIEHWLDNAALIYKPGDNNPTLANGDQATAVALNSFATSANPQVAATSKNFGVSSVNAATAVLSADSVINEYVSGTGTATSWVVTFPTKHHYVDDGLAVAVAPFSTIFKTTGQSCDTVGISMFNREEAGLQPGGTVFSPAPTAAGTQLCYEVNVIDFNGSTNFGTGSNHLGLNTTAVGTSGWVRLGLTNTGNVGGNATVTGLPAIGFAAVVRSSSVKSNYGSALAHAYESGNH